MIEEVKKHYDFMKTPEFALLTRNEKGCYFEALIHYDLKLNGFVFDGNPDSSLYKWYHSPQNGYDVVVNGHKVEVKCMLRPIRLSWFKKSWENRDAEIYVVNDKSMLSKAIMKRIERLSRKIFEPDEFIAFLKAEQSDPNTQ